MSKLEILARALAELILLFAVVAIAFFGLAGSLRDARAWSTRAVFFG